MSIEALSKCPGETVLVKVQLTQTMYYLYSVNPLAMLCVVLKSFATHLCTNQLFMEIARVLLGFSSRWQIDVVTQTQEMVEIR
jgi:hypothetical protein